MEFLKRINDFTLKIYERCLPANKTLVIGDSLLRNFTMQDCDVVSLAGARPEDVQRYLAENNLDKYYNVNIFVGGNSSSVTVKNGRVRPEMSPHDVKRCIDTAAYLHELGIRVFVIGIPRRNATFVSICHFNELLRYDPYRFIYVGVASNMSCETLFQSDGIHLNSYGSTQLKTVINKKIFRFMLVICSLNSDPKFWLPP